MIELSVDFEDVRPTAIIDCLDDVCTKGCECEGGIVLTDVIAKGGGHGVITDEEALKFARGIGIGVEDNFSMFATGTVSRCSL